MTSYGSINKEGKVEEEDVKEIKENLTGLERLRLVASVPAKGGKGRVITVLTNQRLILMNKGEFKLVGKEEGFKDFPFHSIEKIDVEERKGYDLLKISLEDRSEEKHMIPKKSGEKITSILSSLKTQKRREEEQGETPLKKLEKLSKLKEDDAVSEEEFEKKKKEILEGI